MSFEYVNDRRFYSDAPQNLGELGVVPIIVYAMAVSALAAGTAVAAWLSKDGWSVGEYNAYMSEMYQTILLWDKIGWQKGCWNDATRRARWVAFMNAFGKHYSEHGKISGISFVSDSEELPARDLMKQLAKWGDELNTACALNIPSNLPDNTPPQKARDPYDYLTMGVYLVGGILALQLIGAFRSATTSYR